MKLTLNNFHFQFLIQTSLFNYMLRALNCSNSNSCNFKIFRLFNNLLTLMVQIYYLHHCKKEVKIYNYHDLNLYIRRNYLQHNSKELVMLIQSLNLLTNKVHTNNTMHEIFNKLITKNT